MRNERTVIVIEIALTLALAAVLNMLKIYRMPQGGSVSLVMLPLIVLSLRRGLVVGLVAGTAYGLLDFFVDPFVVHWVQYLLDYPVAYLSVGLAGLFASVWRTHSTSVHGILFAVIPACIIATLARYSAHVISGIVFFGQYAPEGQPVVIYSLVYNTYVLLSGIAAFAAATVVLPTVHRAVPVSRNA